MTLLVNLPYSTEQSGFKSVILRNLNDLLGKRLQKVIGDIEHEILEEFIDERDALEFMGGEGVFLNIECVDYIRTLKYRTRILFKYKTNTIEISIFTLNKYINYKKLSIAMSKLLTTLSILGKNNMTIPIFFAVTPVKKTFSNKDTCLGNNANTGATFYRLGKPFKIVIYRDEEYMKVMLHELIHYLNLEFSSTPDIIMKMKKQLRLNSKEDYYNLFEAYTDFFAIVLNVCYNSFLTNIDVEDIMSKEIEYMKLIANKILSLFGMKHILSGNKKLSQTSNITSYYILKLGCFLDLDYFLENFMLGVVTWNKTNINKFYDSIIDRLSSYSFSHYKLKSTESLRMTLGDINIVF